MSKDEVDKLDLESLRNIGSLAIEGLQYLTDWSCRVQDQTIWYYGFPRAAAQPPPSNATPDDQDVKNAEYQRVGGGALFIDCTIFNNWFILISTSFTGGERQLHSRRFIRDGSTDIYHQKYNCRI